MLANGHIRQSMTALVQMIRQIDGDSSMCDKCQHSDTKLSPGA